MFILPFLPLIRKDNNELIRRWDLSISDLIGVFIVWDLWYFIFFLGIFRSYGCFGGCFLRFLNWICGVVFLRIGDCYLISFIILLWFWYYFGHIWHRWFSGVRVATFFRWLVSVQEFLEMHHLLLRTPFCFRKGPCKLVPDVSALVSGLLSSLLEFAGSLSQLVLDVLNVNLLHLGFGLM